MKRRVLSLFLALALAVTMPGATSEAAKKTTKKVALNKKKATLNVGGTVKLKVKNLKKGQKVKWSSNKKNIATVSSKGKVKAKKAGKAVITAKVGKKKLKCNITVQGKNDKTTSQTAKPAETTAITNITVLNDYALQVSLNKAMSLAAANFTVKVKRFANGTYNHTFNVVSVTTSDKKTYTLSLDEQDSILSDGLHLMVTVTASGMSAISKETVCTRDKFGYQYSVTYPETQGESVYERYYLGSYWDDDEYDDDNMNISGWSKVSVTGLPEGLSYKYDDGLYVTFRGTPKQAGTFQSKIVITDELGNTYTINVTWLIGNENTIAASYAAIYGVTGKYGYYLDTSVKVTGGSGEYSFEFLEEDHQGMTIYSDGDIQGNLTKAGNYSISVKVSDKKDSSKTTTAKLQVFLKEARTVSGVVKELKGVPEDESSVIFYNTNKADMYCKYAYTTTNTKGEYSVELPDGTYDAYAVSENGKVIKRLYSIKINGDRSGLDFVLPAYKVAINFDKSVGTWTGLWYDDQETWYGYGDEILLPAGAYNLTSTMNKGYMSYIATAKITVDASHTTVTASISEESYLMGDITEEVPETITLKAGTGNYQYYKFVPTETKKYYIYTEGIYDTEGALYDDSGEYIAYADDTTEGRNFLIIRTLVAGETYYIGVAKYDSSQAKVTLCVSETSPYPDIDDDDLLDW